MEYAEAHSLLTLKRSFLESFGIRTAVFLKENLFGIVARHPGRWPTVWNMLKLIRYLNFRGVSSILLGSELPSL
jgi:hypothetical protein